MFEIFSVSLGTKSTRVRVFVLFSIDIKKKKLLFFNAHKYFMSDCCEIIIIVCLLLLNDFLFFAFGFICTLCIIFFVNNSHIHIYIERDQLITTVAL